MIDLWTLFSWSSVSVVGVEFEFSLAKVQSAWKALGGDPETPLTLDSSGRIGCSPCRDAARF